MGVALCGAYQGAYFLSKKNLLLKKIFSCESGRFDSAGKEVMSVPESEKVVLCGVVQVVVGNQDGIGSRKKLSERRC